MKDDFGYLIAHREFNPVTGKPENISYTWEGGDRVEISYDLLDELYPHSLALKTGDSIRLFEPYRLRVIENRFPFGTVECIRERGIVTDAIILVYRATRVFRLIYHRLIITMAVWGLARFQREAIPSWSDIHLLRKLEETIKRK